MIEVEVDGKVLEFPDGTSPQEIESILAESRPAKSNDVPMSWNRPGPTIKAAGQLRANKMGPFRKALYGAERALYESGAGVKQLTVGLTPEEENEIAVQRATEQQIPGTWMSRLAMDVAQYAAPSSWALKAAGAATKLPAAVRAYLGAAGSGAAIAATQPVLGNESRGANAMSGALWGGLGQAGGDLVGAGVRGVVAKNPSIANLPQALHDKLSLGQTADRNTWTGRVAANTEERLQSVPIGGEIIRGKRQGATDAWREDLLQRVSPEGVVPTGANTREKLDSIYKGYRNKYSAALANNQVPPSQLFEQQVLKLTNNPRSGLPDTKQEEVRKIVMDYYRSMFHGNNPPTGPAGNATVPLGGHRGSPISADAATAKDFEAFLSAQARQYRNSNAPGSDSTAKMFEDLERAWSVSYRRSLPSSARVATKKLDQGYAPYKTVERAAGYTGNDFGNFTPQQLVQAVRSRTSDSKFGRGQGILQDEAQAARDVLIDRVPNSGTADRALTLGALGGAAFLDPGTTAATLGLGVPAMVTKTGRNIMTGDTKIQKLLQQLRMPQSTGAVTGATFQDLMNPEFTE